MSARKISSIESIPFSRTQERSLSQKMSLLEAQFPATVSHAANYPACATPMHCSPRQPEAGSSSLRNSDIQAHHRRKNEADHAPCRSSKCTHSTTPRRSICNTCRSLCRDHELLAQRDATRIPCNRGKTHTTDCNIHSAGSKDPERAVFRNNPA